MNRGEIAEVASEILAYLANNPDAGDTMEGIVEWWLLEQKIKRENERVKKALDELVAMGLVIERKRKNSRTYYRVNKRRLDEVRALVDKKTDSEGESGSDL